MASYGVQREGIAAGATYIDVRDFLGTVECDHSAAATIASPPTRREHKGGLIHKAWRALAWLVSVVVSRVCGWLVKRKEPLPVELPIGFEAHEATTEEGVESLLVTLGQHKKSWIQTSLAVRAALLHECRTCAIQVSRRAAQAAVQAHGSYGSGCGEERLEWIPVVLALKELEEAMKRNADVKPISLRKRVTNSQYQYIAEVFPAGVFSLLFPNVKGEVWMKPGMDASQSQIYRSKESTHSMVRKKKQGPSEGRVALVLGSGHQLSAIILDVLQKLFVEDEVVLLKLNPVNEFLGQYIAAALKPLIHRGFVALSYGPTKQGIAMCRNPLVHSVRVTGSEDTYNAIVRGRSTTPGVGYPPLNKPVKVELGSVSPIIVVPGRWTDEDLDHQVEVVAAALSYNSGHCSAGAEVLIMDKTWPQRPHFIEKLRQKLKKLPQRVGWYPKSRQKQRGLQRTFPDIEELGIYCSGTNVSTLPYLLVTGQTPEESSTRMETWTTALQEVMLDNAGNTTLSFLEEAVLFVNDSCWGSVSCTILLHPATKRELGSHFEHIIAELKYGNIVVNAPGRMGFAITSLSWGGFPGSLPRSIGVAQVASGHNTMMFDYPEKSVLHFPFRLPHPALWSPTLANLEEVVDKAIAFIDSPSVLKSCAFYTALSKG